MELLEPCLGLCLATRSEVRLPCLTQDWATPAVRNNVKDMLRYGYYAMYALMEVFVFLLLPLAYFFFEEKDEEAGTTTRQRLCAAFKYTLGFLVVMGVLMCIGCVAAVCYAVGRSCGYLRDFACVRCFPCVSVAFHECMHACMYVYVCDPRHSICKYIYIYIRACASVKRVCACVCPTSSVTLESRAVAAVVFVCPQA